MTIEIREISVKDIDAFVEFPYGLYRDHPCWAGELFKDAKKLLTAHPFWSRARHKFFMAKSEKGYLGRIAAIVSERHNEFHGEKTGFFGFFDLVDSEEVCRTLTAAACGWLKSENMEKVRGPVNPSMNETCGMLAEGFDEPPVIMMPYNCAYYNDLIVKAGFSKIKDLYAFRYRMGDFGEKLGKIEKRLRERQRVKIKHTDVKKIEMELSVFREIYNQAWSENWGFVPMEEDEIAYLAKSLKPVLKPDYLFFAEINGKPAGFTLMLPDFNIPLRTARGRLGLFNIVPFLLKMRNIDGGRMLALGVKKEFRNKGIELALIKHAIERSKINGWKRAELSWTLEDNSGINKIIGAVGGEIYKKYRIYEKTL